MSMRTICTVLLLLVTLTSSDYSRRAAYIVVSKADLKMKVFDVAGREFLEFPVACGKNLGQKQQAGDNRTPEGVFRVTSRENSSYWTYDFGHGPVKGAYGPLFFRLRTPGFTGVGIHGTHDPASVPGRATHGCLRLRNDDLLTLAPYITIGTIVIILPEGERLPAGDTFNENSNHKIPLR